MHPAKPYQLAQKPSFPCGRVCLREITPPGFSSSVSSSSSSLSEPLNATFRHQLQRRNPVIPDTVKLPPGVLPQPASSGPRRASCPHEKRPFYFLVRRREQPGRRKDSTQSLYIDRPECDLLTHFSSCPPSTSSSSSSISMAAQCPPHQCNEMPALEDHRCSPDPDILYMDNDV